MEIKQGHAIRLFNRFVSCNGDFANSAPGTDRFSGCAILFIIKFV